MYEELTYPSADKKTAIHAYIWRPHGQVRAVVQIIHGMAEYALRYAPFAEYLAARGFLVCAEDHLGHGRSVLSADCLGYFDGLDGSQTVLADIRSLTGIVRAQAQGLPFFIMGHSMGSFFCRKYISLYGGECAGAIIMGTGFQPALLTGFGKLVSSVIALFRGEKHRSAFIDKLAFGGYNKKFEPARTPSDWLTKDAAIIDSYISNPSCTFIFTVNAYQSMFRSIRSAQDGSQIARIPKDLPILVVSGTNDPVGNFGRGVRQVYDAYRSAGIQDVSISLYDGDRHEILNETDREQVYQDLLAWMEGRQKI